MKNVQLDPPGAGLPISQRLFAKLLVRPIISKIVPLNKARQDYEFFTKKIIEDISSVPLEKRNIPILVRPISGLEDSSRNWSLNAVLEHLLLVTRSIEGAIRSLGKGIVPAGQGDPVTAKPTKMDQDLLGEFKEYAPDILKRIDEEIKDGGINIHSKLEYVHVWFGGLNARQWYWLLSRHQSIHSTQVSKIIVSGFKV